MATGSFSDYARHIGASPAYVSKLKSQGRLDVKCYSFRFIGAKRDAGAKTPALVAPQTAEVAAA